MINEDELSSMPAPTIKNCDACGTPIPIVPVDVQCKTCEVSVPLCRPCAVGALDTVDNEFKHTCSFCTRVQHHPEEGVEDAEPDEDPDVLIEETEADEYSLDDALDALDADAMNEIAPDEEIETDGE